MAVGMAIGLPWVRRRGGFALPCPDSAVQWLKTAPAGVWLPDSVGTGTARTPQQGRCYTFNGTNETVSFGGEPNDLFTGDWCIAFSLHSENTGYILDKFQGSLSINYGSSLAGNIFVGNSSGGVRVATTATGRWVVIHDSSGTGFGRYRIFKDGVELSLTPSGSYVAPISTATTLKLGCRSSGAPYYGGKLSAVQVYTVVPTADEIAALTEFDDAAMPALADCELWAWCDEQAGSTTYDCSGKGNNGTITSVALSTFHGSTQNVYSRQNQVGYSEGGGGVFIPRDESDPTNDVLGNPLDYTGRVPLPAKIIQSHCLTFDGASEYVNFGNTFTNVKTIAFRVKLNSVTSHTDYLFQGASGKHVLIQNGSIVLVGFTGTNVGYVDGVEVVGAIGSTGWHTIVLTNTTGHDFDAFQFGRVSGLGYADVSVCDIRLSTSVWSEANAATYHAEAGEDSTLDFLIQWPCADGASNFIYDVLYGNGDEQAGTITGTPAALWAERQDIFHYNANQGFGNYGGGRLIPAMLNGTIAAAEQPLTNPVVACWNHSESHIDFDPYGVPELSAFSNDYDPDVDDLALDGSQWVRRLSATQWNDFASYSASLTGDCLASATTKFSIPTHLNSLILEHYPLQATEDADPGLRFAPSLGSYYLGDGNPTNLVATAIGKNGNGLYIADDGGSYSSALGIAIGSNAAWNTDNAHTVAMWVKLNAKSSATDLKLMELQNGGGAGNYWTIFYDQSADRFAVTDGTNTLTDTVSPSLSQWYLLVLAVDLAGNANFYVMLATDGITGLRKQSVSGWYVTTQNIGTINVCHTLAENEETVMDELLFFGNGTRRLYDNEILHLARENYATAGSF